MANHFNQLVFVWVLVLSLNSPVVAQVGINTNDPDSSSVLDVYGTNRGFLLPRMSSAQRADLQKPANSLVVYDTRHRLFYFFDATDTGDPLFPDGQWKAMNPWTMRANQLINSNDYNRNDNPVFFTWPGRVGIGTETPGSKLGISSNLSVGRTYADEAAPTDGLIVEGSIGIGTTTPGAKVHINDPGAMIIPAGTTAQRPSLSDAGGMRYNTQTGNTETHDGDQWKVLIPVGTILPFAGSAVPAGWLLCDGQAVDRTEYVELYRAIGTAWGYGNGASTFNVPDLRGMFLRGVDYNANRDPDHDSRQPTLVGGNGGNNVGSVQLDDVGPHVHGIDDPGHAHGYQDEYNRGELSDNADDRTVGSDGRDTADKSTANATTGITVQQNAGVETRPKNAYVNYIIKF